MSAPVIPAQNPADIVAEVEQAAERLTKVKDEIGKAIFGQANVVEETLVSILSGGHCLLVGMPGLGKTRLVQTVGTVMGLSTGRVQFTPDLMPSDILGSEVMHIAEDGIRSFRFLKGPIFAQLLISDEINRASPRTQSALLQAMQERVVTIAGASYQLPAPFHVLATQNPLEQEGTYPLPEAQLDRFMMKIDVTYPDLPTEQQILLQTTGLEDLQVASIIDPAEILKAQQLVRTIPVGESVVSAILSLVRSARPTTENNGTIADRIAWGPGPRASQALMLAVRARALLQGRFAPSVDDVLALARPVLQHRMALSYTARAERHTEVETIAELCDPLR